MSPGSVQRPTVQDVRIFGTQAEFREWLNANHESAGPTFIGFFKKGVPRMAMTYPQAVEEALCFGWIDGITYRIDDEITATRFTPRRRTSNWSAINIARMAELDAAGRLHPAGRQAFEQRDRRRDATYSYEQPPLELAGELLARLRSDGKTWAYWQAERPSFRRQVAYWIMAAKRPETRERRFEELMVSTAEGRRPRRFIVERTDRS